MRKSFEYLYTIQASDCLEVEDVGNTCIHILNDIGHEWYMIIETELGETRVKTFGPFHVDMNNYFNHGFNFNYTVMDYKESRICNLIDNFINDSKKLITQAFVCESDEAYDKLCSLNLKEMR